MLEQVVVGDADGPVNAYTSTRSTLAGLLPSVLVAGARELKLDVVAAAFRGKVGRAAGSFTSGGSGGPFFPHAEQREHARNRDWQQPRPPTAPGSR